MSSIYLSFSPKLTRMFVRLYILLRSRSYVQMDIFLRHTELCQVFKILEVFLQVKFALIFVSEKPNLLKLSKSNIFVMHKRWFQLQFELPKIRDFPIISRYIYFCILNSFFERFLCKGMDFYTRESRQSSYDLVYCLADQLAALALWQKIDLLAIIWQITIFCTTSSNNC